MVYKTSVYKEGWGMRWASVAVFFLLNKYVSIFVVITRMDHSGSFMGLFRVKFILKH